MRTKEKLNRYFESNGISKLWFAKKIGTTRRMLYGILLGTWLAPRKHWYKIIELSQGYVKAEDLISDQIHHMFKDFPLIQVEEKWEDKMWIITAKMPEKNP